MQYLYISSLCCLSYFLRIYIRYVLASVNVKKKDTFSRWCAYAILSHTIKTSINWLHQIWQRQQRPPMHHFFFIQLSEWLQIPYPYFFQKVFCTKWSSWKIIKWMKWISFTFGSHWSERQWPVIWSYLLLSWINIKGTYKKTPY